ncbi:uncharacterized protein LOC120348477 [Styela clava]
MVKLSTAYQWISILFIVCNLKTSICLWNIWENPIEIKSPDIYSPKTASDDCPSNLNVPTISCSTGNVTDFYVNANDTMENISVQYLLQTANSLPDEEFTVEFEECEYKIEACTDKENRSVTKVNKESGQMRGNSTITPSLCAEFTFSRDEQNYTFSNRNCTVGGLPLWTTLRSYLELLSDNTAFRGLFVSCGTNDVKCRIQGKFATCKDIDYSTDSLFVCHNTVTEKNVPDTSMPLLSTTRMSSENVFVATPRDTTANRQIGVTTSTFFKTESTKRDVTTNLDITTTIPLATDASMTSTDKENTRIPIITNSGKGDIERILVMSHRNDSDLTSKTLIIEESMKSLVISASSVKTFARSGVEIVVLPNLSTTKGSNKSVAKLSKSEVHTIGQAQQVKIADVSVAQLNTPLSAYNTLLPVPPASTGPKKTTSFLSDGSPLLSITAYEPTNHNKLNIDVIFSINVSEDSLTQPEFHDPKKILEQVHYECVFYNITTQKMSKQGCQLVQYNIGSKITCECNHTTMFAALMSLTIVEIPNGVKVCSYITQTISVLALLVVCIIIHRVRKHLRGDRATVQICLSASLLCLHLMSLFHDIAIQNDIACEFVAVLTHYFLLSSGMWMLMEGITISFKTTNYVLRYSEFGRHIEIGRHLLSWGLPAVIVLISAGVGFMNEKYMDPNPTYNEYKTRNKLSTNIVRKYNSCWLQTTALMGSVIIPISAILLINILIVIRMTCIICRMTSATDNLRPSGESQGRERTPDSKVEESSIRSSLKFYALFLPVLGVPWVTGYLVGVENRTASTMFMYVNVLLNGLQGVFLFIIYCFVTSETRDAIVRYWNRRMNSLQVLRFPQSYSPSCNRKFSRSLSTGETWIRTKSLGQKTPSPTKESSTVEPSSLYSKQESNV